MSDAEATNTVAPTTGQDAVSTNESESTTSENTGQDNLRGETATETAQNIIERNLGKRHKKRVFGRDRAQEALDKATLADITAKANKPSLEDLDTAELPEGGVKGINFNEVLSALPEDAKQLLGNLRSDYTRKTQDLANQRKELRAQQAALQESDFYRTMQEKANAENVELDPYDTKSFEARIEQEVARRLNDMLEPMRQQQNLEMKRIKLTQFRNEHPDLENLKGEVAATLKANTNLSLEEAYYIVKGRQKKTELETQRQQKKEERQERRANSLKVGRPTQFSGNKPPKGLKGYEIYEWFERNGRK